MLLRSQYCNILFRKVREGYGPSILLISENLDSCAVRTEQTRVSAPVPRETFLSGKNAVGA